MKVVIAGSRYKDLERKVSFDDYLAVVNAVKNSKFNVTEVISGCAIGVDKLGEKWAVVNNCPIISMPADWNRYGKAAGPIRNRQMAEIADAAVIIWDGKSTGTLNMINEMKRLNKPYFIDVIRENEDPT